MIANWRRRNPSAPSGDALPLALVEKARGTRRLAAVDLAAHRLGLRGGQKATDALALVPDLVIAPAEPEADARALKALVDWCVRFSPAVAADPPDGLFLDIEGVAHLWEGEAALMADLRARLSANGLPFRLALADTAGAAWALAHYGEDGAIAPPGGQDPLLAPLPPAALRLAPQAAEQIERLGLRRIGQLMELPRGPLAQRFGQETLDRLDQALGRGREALVFRRPPSPWFARLAFAEPISAPEDLARVSRDIADVLCARLEREGKGARRFELAFHRLDGVAQTLEIGLSLAGRDPVRIARLFAPRLETVDPGFGVEVATLTAARVETLSARQTRLDRLDETAPEEGLAPLVDRLANRLGADRVWKAGVAESHLPERAVVPRPALAKVCVGWDPERPRPLRLFRRPEPLDQVLALTPDDPPRQFRWRKRLHRVARAEGPERLAAEWWRQEIGEVRTDEIRDYYRVEDQDGARFWVFRDGLYGTDRTPQWWLHGVFG